MVIDRVDFNTAYPIRFLEGLQGQFNKRTAEKGERPFYVVCTPDVLRYFAEMEEEYEKDPAPGGYISFDNAPTNVLVRYFDEQMEKLNVEVRSDMIVITRKLKKPGVEKRAE